MSSTQNKKVLVTGVTGGIGGAVAQLLASQGAKLAITGRDQARLDAAKAELPAESVAAAIVADLTVEADVQKLIADAKAALGGLDVLINVPGVSVPGKIAEADVEAFQTMMDVNVKATFLCCKHFVQQADEASGGLIVNISSIAGKAANPGAPLYCTAKAALNMLSSGLALQTKAANIRVTTVSPGAVSTPGFWGDRPVPHEKFLKPDDVADVVSYVVGLPEHIVMHDVVFEPWNFYKTK